MNTDIKEKGLKQKGLNNTLFVYDSNNFTKFCHLFLK